MLSVINYPPPQMDIITEQVVVDLPEVIMEEILSWLPVQPLLRFRCVSKSWRSLIDSKRFIKSHLQKSKKKAVCVRSLDLSPFRPHHFSASSPFDFEQLNLSQFRPQQYSASSPAEQLIVNWLVNIGHPCENSTKLDIIGCCNGLVCVTACARLFLWNPSTRTVWKVPEIDRLDRWSKIGNIGFGWDDSRDDYKVFALVQENSIPTDSTTVTARVYSPKTNYWKRIALKHKEFYLPDHASHFVAGKLHWIHSPDPNVEKGNKYIVTFDLKTEKIGRIESPADDEHCSILELGVIGGCLCCVLGRGRRRIEVWVMKQYGCWVNLMAEADVRELLQHPFSAPYKVCPDGEGEIVLFMPSSSIGYCPKSNAFRRPPIIRLSCERDCLHIESLVSPR